MKKRFVLFAILMIASLMLGACKPKAKPEAPAVEAPVVEEPAVEKPAAEEPAKEEPAKEEPVVAPPSTPDATLRIWADDTRSAILAPLADAFLAEYNVKVIIEEVANIRDQFIIAAPAGEGPDITIVPHDQAGQLVASGLLAPIAWAQKPVTLSILLLTPSLLMVSCTECPMRLKTWHFSIIKTWLTLPQKPGTNWLLRAWNCKMQVKLIGASCSLEQPMMLSR